MKFVTNLTNSVVIYFLVYGIISFIIMRTANKSIQKKVLTMAPHHSPIERIAVTLSKLFQIMIIVFAAFIRIDTENPNFYIGFALYLVGLCLTSLALWQYSRVDLSEPITNGIYKITRHPMQLMFILMLIGIMLVAGNEILNCFVFLYAISSYPMLKMQERFCIEKYGTKYLDYMKKTPRFFFFNIDFVKMKE